MDTETKPIWTTEREAMGKTWTVGLWPTDTALSQTGDGRFESNLEGHTNLGKQIVHILATAHPDRRDESLLHELMETCFVETGTPFEERTIQTVSLTLFAFLRGFGLWREFPWPDREPPKRSYFIGTLEACASGSTVGPDREAFYGGRP